MSITRRHFTLSALALGVSACASGAPRVAGQTSAGGLPPGMRPVANPAYEAWVASFRARASGYGISEATVEAAFQGTGYLPGVVERDRNQIEKRRTLEDYLSITVSDERVAKGRAAFARQRSLLAGLEQKYGVDAAIIAAIWGVESTYGEKRGMIPVISATSTLAFDGRRGAFYEKQLVAALKILQKGEVSPRNMLGSWAGAMGHTQFIPTSYQAFAVDYTGDGRRDIWSPDPADALASTAAYLARNGWSRGQKWGALAGTGAGGRIVQPQPGGPRFAVGRNFNAIKRYNNSDFYAIGIGLLSDRILGAGPLQAGFPPDEYGMTRADRLLLQQRLTAKGFDTNGFDGVIGRGTRAAISAYQQSAGLPVTGAPSLELLQRLR